MGGPMYQLVSKDVSSGLTIHNTPFTKKSQVKVARDLPKPTTISTAEPFRRGSAPKVVFEVSLPRKDCRTAIGFVGLPDSTTAYLTPDYIPKGYVSMGGAGFIYPSKEPSTKGYAEGDRVKVELAWDKNRVTFFVNAEEVGSARWDGSDVAFPALSVFPGSLQADVTFKS